MYALEISQLTKQYKNGVTALNGIELKVKDGDFYALLGHNGAGKSTTIGIINTLVHKSGGTVKVFGYDLDQQPNQLKAMLGVVPQEFNFNQFELVIDILVNQAGYYGIPRKEALSRAEYWLKKLDLWEKRHQQSIRLSGGMKRRLMIARALMHNPKLLILDEPTAGVDIELRRTMWHFLQELNQQGTTIILTTHYLEEAEMLCRHIGIIQQGKLVIDMPMKALLAQLETETLILDLAPDSPTPTLTDYPILSNQDNSLEIEVHRQQGLTSLFSQLAQQGIEVLSMRNKTNRLEELFVSMALNKKAE
ncbi:ATP-binding cassette domain-containing protein [[Haemophilus] felis]|uniref:ABC transporter n=1 Tax=[Haemophilus] felis TaxID=123822 RepID=A0A1T0AXJ3_9PAST|nr:ATP-binding cassette domain-containing protein [[Haemophilus] felis]NBI41617.1 ATP-binding cassette domain-containing protein [[Haemophilus] felis]OOS02673.1 ABC transporter [[Haemophilus] felis]